MNPRTSITPPSRTLRILCCFLALVTTCLSGPADREEISLNGIWDFYPNGGTERHDIRVPSFWDAPQDYGYPEEWLHMRHGIYKKSFRVPESMRGKQVFIRIQSVSVIAKLFINGTQVGAEDSNGYLMLQLPYLIDLTRHLRMDGDNQLEVRAWGGKSMIAPTDSQDMLMAAREDDFPPDTKIDGNFLYPYCVDHWDGRRGLNGDVSLVAKPKVHVEDVFVIPNLHKNGDPLDDEVMIRLTVANCADQSVKIRVFNKAAQKDGSGAKDFEPMTVALPPRSRMDFTIQNVGWPDANYWWPHDPQLYFLETTLVENGTTNTIDTKRTRFGFREFYVKGDHYQLNGIRANVRGDAYEFSWHEGFRHGPSTAPVFSTKELIPQLQEQLVREYAKLNHNMLRPHKASAYAGLYDLCDEIGMMVFDEAPFWETWVRTNELSKPYYEAWIHRWIKERRNHPSIMAWIGANECWFGSTGIFAVQAIRTMDTSRPSFHEDPWGSGIHHDDITEPYEGDSDCRHYSGGYPIKKLNTEDLYEVYRANPRKPTGEGESLYPEGFPLTHADGSYANKVSERGEFGHPDMISQGTWIRSVCRMFRAMRYAGLSDARLYANWMLAFDPVEADIPLEWEDLTAPGIKPVVLRRPIMNVFTDKHPRIRHGAGYDYYKNSFAPVAVFDKEGDRQNRIGAAPLVFNGKDVLSRTLVVYNDEFSNGRDITVQWNAGAHDPHTGETAPIASGTFTIPVPYGEKREQLVRFELPEKPASGRWLHLTLTTSKSEEERYQETYRLGALVSPPLPKLEVGAEIIDLGEITQESGKQWHSFRLTNTGGGASELWTLEAPGEIRFKLSSGNLRTEQDLHFQIDPATAKSGANSREITIKGASGTHAALTVKYHR